MANSNTNQKAEKQNFASELSKLIDSRNTLSQQILDIEGKENPSEVERYAVEGMRNKLAEFDKQIGPQMEANVIAQLFDVASSITKEALISEDTEYVIKLKSDGSDPEIGRLKGRAKRKLEGEKQSHGKYAWNVDGKDISNGATVILKDLANKMVLLTGGYNLTDVRGVSARLGWKIAAAAGPVVLLMQGKKTGEKLPNGKDVCEVSDITLSSGKVVKLNQLDNRMYCHRRALEALALDRNDLAVKDAIQSIRDLLHDAMKEDGCLPEGNKKVSVKDLMEYIKAQHKIASQCHADRIS